MGSVPLPFTAGSSLGVLTPGTSTNPFKQASSEFTRNPTAEEVKNNTNATTIETRWKNAAEEEKKIANSNSEFGLGTDYIAVDPSVSTGGVGSLAKVFRPKPGKNLVDILKRYTWTVSQAHIKNDTPYIRLLEHEVDGGQIQQQLAFYAQGVFGAVGDIANAAIGRGGAADTVLDVYKEIFPRNPTGFTYRFPYFAKAYYEINTPQWQQFDKIGNAASQISSGAQDVTKSIGDVLGGLPGAVANTFAGSMKVAQSLGGFAAQTGITGLQALYPVVGIADRPRIFTAHNERTITIDFPLYNTINSWDWLQNKDFIHLFAAQNLFNKRNFITGLPPVWYEVYVPGSYYSVASCVTNFNVQNLGNIRLMKQGETEFTVPDAYQVTISLTEMALPSRNQFQAANSKLGLSRVTTSTKESKDLGAEEARSQLARGNAPAPLGKGVTWTADPDVQPRNRGEAAARRDANR